MHISCVAIFIDNISAKQYVSLKHRNWYGENMPWGMRNESYFGLKLQQLITKCNMNKGVGCRPNDILFFMKYNYRLQGYEYVWHNIYNIL